MKLLLLTLLVGLLVGAQIVFGAAYLSNTNAQVFTPNGMYTRAITAKSETVNLTTRIAYKIRTSAACIFRMLPTTSKASYPAVSIEAASVELNGVNIATPFLNHSGCVGTREEM